jgi:TRAP-type C4-dicarboxylate transport system substrate-binding protein
MIAEKIKKLGFPILVMSLLTASPLYAQNKIVWQYSLSDIVPNTVYMVYSEEIIPARVKEATKGRLELVPLRGVVKSADVLDAVRDRRVDMGVQGAPHRADTALYDFAAVPGLAQYEILKAAHPDLEKIFEADMRSRFGLEMLGYGYWPRQMVLSKKPIATFEDLKGMKLRAHSVALQLVLRSAGAKPVAMPFGDVYVGLQRNTIEGAVSGMIAFSAVKWYENAKFTSSWPLGSANYVFIVNGDAWAELPDDLKPIVRKTVYDAGLETWQGALDEEQRTITVLKEAGVTHTVPSESDRAKLSAGAKPLLAAWKERAGAQSKAVLDVLNKHKIK